MARPRKQVYTMEQYIRNVEDDYISNDADTQRVPEWKAIVDGLAVTVLTDDYVPVIILAEEDNGQIHIVDGGSRTAAFRMIRYGNYKIKSSVENPIIQYKAMSKDENGKAVWEDAEFDIRNKTFDQFPKELQKKFDEYQVDTVVHEHCNKEKIAMYIKRYNEHKAMNANQKMFVYLPAFAEKIRDISKRNFFINNCVINDNEKDKGMLERVISETVMTMFHFDKWNKNGKKIATYLNENASVDEFNKLDSNLERLESIITDTTKILFNSKDSFIWLTLFDKFTQYGLDDAKFGEFLDAFVNELKDKPIDDKLFYTVDEKGSTKDKSVIVDKLHILETLMKEFLHIEEVEEVKDILKFVKKNVNPYITEEDIELYSDILDGLTLEVDNNTKLLNEDNRPSLLALVGYACKNDIDLDDWIKQWFISNTTYLLDQRKNYEIMKDNLSKYMYEKGGNLYRRSMERYQ